RKITSEQKTAAALRVVEEERLRQEEEKFDYIEDKKESIPFYIEKEIEKTASVGGSFLEYGFASNEYIEIIEHVRKYFEDKGFKVLNGTKKESRCLNYDMGDWEDYYVPSLEIGW